MQIFRFRSKNGRKIYSTKPKNTLHRPNLLIIHGLQKGVLGPKTADVRFSKINCLIIKGPFLKMYKKFLQCKVIFAHFRQGLALGEVRCQQFFDNPGNPRVVGDLGKIEDKSEAKRS